MLALSVDAGVVGARIAVVAVDGHPTACAVRALVIRRAGVAIATRVAVRGVLAHSIDAGVIRAWVAVVALSIAGAGRALAVAAGLARWALDWGSAASAVRALVVRRAGVAIVARIAVRSVLALSIDTGVVRAWVAVVAAARTGRRNSNERSGGPLRDVACVDGASSPRIHGVSVRRRPVV